MTTLVWLFCLLSAYVGYRIGKFIHKPKNKKK